MKHTYSLDFYETDGSLKSARKLVSGYDDLRRDMDLEDIIRVSSADKHRVLDLYHKALRQNIGCWYEVTTRYDRTDALAGSWGILGLGPTNTGQYGVSLPADAFNGSRGCSRCGLGSIPTKPHLVSQRVMRAKTTFYDGHVGTNYVLIRAEIGKEIIDATGWPECMRHPMTREGEVVKEWMEPVPTAILPSLSVKSEGILQGSTTALSDWDQPPKVFAPCIECGRNVWATSFREPERLVYDHAKVAALKQHPVVLMHEPHNIFPTFATARGVFKPLNGYPWILFNRTVIEVLLKYIKFFSDDMSAEHMTGSVFIQPVFVE